MRASAKHVTAPELDVSGAEPADEAHRQRQRAEAVSTLASSVAHDLNNTLMVLAANLEALRVTCASVPDAAELLDEMDLVTRDAAVLLERLNRMRHTQDITFQSVSLAALTEGAVAQLHALSPDPLTIDVDLSGELRVLGSPRDLHRAVLTLLADATTQMQTVYVVGRVERLSRTRAAKEQVAAGTYARLSVSTDGALTAPRSRRSSTMVDEIVRGHGGIFCVRTGHTTELQLLLPAV